MSFSSNIQRNISLAPYTTFQIGGPAEYFIEAKTREELLSGIDWAQGNKYPLTILAGGSNVLISDAGIKGLVIKLSNDDLVLKGERLECGAGANLMRVSRMANGAGLSGLEWGIGIPGTVGGAVRGNAGAYGIAIGGVVENIEAINIKKSTIKNFSVRDCEFKYKESIFKKENFWIIWKIVLKLRKGDLAEIKKISENYAAQRNKTQPKLPSAGCVFKNFSLDYIMLADPELAKYAEEKGMARGGKVGAGWVIDLLGLKGRVSGNAKISLEHANFIVNTGRAEARDVLELIRLIKDQARKKFNLEMEEEVQLLGFLG